MTPSWTSIKSFTGAGEKGEKHDLKKDSLKAFYFKCYLKFFMSEKFLSVWAIHLFYGIDNIIEDVTSN